jgi:transcriptional regulator with XRE-family HTH domain
MAIAQDEAVELGQKIRALRKERKQTLTTVADGAGVSRSLISQVERGLASPSITTLRRIAAVLEVPVAALFLNDAAEQSNGDIDRFGRPLVVRHDERKGLHLPRSGVVYELLTPDLNRKVEFIWIEYGPGDVSPSEMMSHPGEENAVCIQGSVVVIIEGDEFVLGEGDSISFDANRPHRVENRSDRRAVLISAISPPAF